MSTATKRPRPRALFKSRRKPTPDSGEQLRQAMLEVELERPHGEIIVERLLTEFADKIKPGGIYQAVVSHAPHCPRDESCRCMPSATLLELSPSLD